MTVKFSPDSFSKPIFLHFLSRGILESVNAYHELNKYRITDDLKLTLLSTYENTYISTAHLFENQFTYRIFQEYPNLFYYGHIEVSQKESSLSDLITKKKEQYRHIKDKPKYKAYWDNQLPEIIDINPKIKLTDGVSNDLEKLLIEKLRKISHISDKETSNHSIETIKENSKYLIDIIQNRNGMAITSDIFMPFFQKETAHKELIRQFDIFFVNELYILVHLNRENGTIMTGLSNGAEYYSYLSRSFPGHNLRIWSKIYHVFGLRLFVSKLNDIDIYTIRENVSFVQFIDIVRKLIHYFYYSEKIHNVDIIFLRIKSILDIFCLNYLSKITKINTANDFLLLLEPLVTHLNEHYVEMFNISICNNDYNEMSKSNFMHQGVNHMDYLDKLEEEYNATRKSLIEWQKQERLSSDNPDKKEIASNKIIELRSIISKYELQIVDEVSKSLPQNNRDEFVENINTLQKGNSLPQKITEQAKSKVKKILDDHGAIILKSIGKGLSKILLEKLGYDPQDWGIG